ncbi:retrovirus-related Pol polyprotein from transposon TNT 1-94 isoform X1 [Beta vulgaris subsp. vulgaris]|uniref:retrovirus-related Pol polyprotein from transposon TNT 1-94 isoform X1 n=1 Tax=Beta vulgaris subsp. vulgaris TaxID=3555 RepID=UPI0020367881|nr:retrovirus-related Pol polyprotein from transposon TNT 1-94 isoform X1 [Beta vulgaris subsp. vulgaris]
MGHFEPMNNEWLRKERRKMSRCCKPGHPLTIKDLHVISNIINHVVEAASEDVVVVKEEGVMIEIPKIIRGETSTRGHGRGRGMNQYQRSNDKANIQCYNCNKYGHFAWECYSKKVQEETNLIENKDDTEESTMLLALKIEDKKDDNLTWYLDNGASNHMTGDKNKFVDLDTSVTCNVTFGYGSKVKIEGKGTIMIELKDSSHKLRSNILSVGQLLEVNGCKIMMEGQKLWLRDRNSNLITTVSMTKNRMFLINLQTIGPMCLKTCAEDPSWKWHMRFGHLNFENLKEIGHKKMVRGLPCIDHPNQLCEACLPGKQPRKAFPKPFISRATKPLEVVHSDICRPIKPKSLGKSSYFILFIDDYSRKTLVYFLKNKSEAFDTFKTFKAMVEKESGYEIKALRTDRGGEFTSNEFNKCFEDHGIRRSLTVPRTPQQNGVAKRKNRTILNRARLDLC